MNDFAHHYYPKWKIIIKRGTSIIKHADMFNQLNNLSANLEEESEDLMQAIESYNPQTKAARELIEKLKKNPTKYSVFDIVLKPTIVPPRLTKKEQEEIDDIRKMVANSIGKFNRHISEAVEIRKKIDSQIERKELRDVPQSITVSRTEHILSQATISFWDPHSEIFSSIDEADKVEIEVGWAGATNDRYKVQKVFTGIITNKSTTLGASAGQTTITCHDERAKLADRIINDVSESGEKKWLDFLRKKFKEADEEADFGLLREHFVDESAEIIHHNETDLDRINALLKNKEYVVYQEFDPNGKKHYLLGDDDDRRNVYHFVWKDNNMPPNVISFNASVNWEQAEQKKRASSPNTAKGDYLVEKYKQREKDSQLNRARPDKKGLRLTTSLEGVGDDMIFVGNGTDDYRPVSPFVKNEDKSKKKKLDGFNYTASLTLRGEPQISTRDVIYIQGVSKYCDGKYYVKSVNHSLGTSNFTTTVELEYKFEPLDGQLKQVFDEHFETNKYWGPLTKPNTTNTGLTPTPGVPTKVKDYIIKD